MVVTSDQMKRWSALLASEITAWPRVRTKHMFGFLSYYRKDTMFAILPRTRSFDSGDLIIVKFDPLPAKPMQRAQRDARVDTLTRRPGRGWFTFALQAEADVRDALWWLDQAFACAGKTRAREY